MPLTIEVQISEFGRCRIALFGRLDAATAPQFDQTLAGLDRKCPIQVLDLEGLEYMSSAGLRSVFKARKAAEAEKGQLLLLNPQPQVRKVFEIVQALPSRSLFTSTEELDRYVDTMLRKEAEDP